MGPHLWFKSPYESAVQRLWRITERLNTLHEANWTAEVREVVDNFTSHVVAAAGEGYRDGKQYNP